MKRSNPWGYGFLALILIGTSSLFVYDLDGLEGANVGRVGTMHVTFCINNKRI